MPFSAATGAMDAAYVVSAALANAAERAVNINDLQESIFIAFGSLACSIRAMRNARESSVLVRCSPVHSSKQLLCSSD
jgi:hypothetical protein